MISAAVQVNSTPSTVSSLAARFGTLMYGVLAYGGFVAAITYAVGFVNNIVVPKSIDSGPAGPVVPALLINSGLLMLFVLQHTIMARPAFKAWITRFMPTSIERSTYVLAASVCFGLLFGLWRPAPQVLWETGSPALAWALRAVSIAGFAIVLLASFMISHFDLFGLRQTWFRFRNRPYEPVGFRLVGFYRLIRHPLMLGFLIAFWATPAITVGHLFFAIMVSIYIAMGVWFEERDLIAQHGEEYLKYRRRVRGILPIPRASR